MNLNTSLKYTKEKLKKGGVSAFELEAYLIFNDLLGIKKEDFFINPDRILKNDELGKVNNAIRKRENGYPLQYILGKWEFYGYPFYVGENVLIPRQDTEILIDEAYEILKELNNPKIIDLCSGSGCIGISLKKLIPDAQVHLVEYSSEAIKYIEKNLELNNITDVNIIHGDALSMDVSSIFLDGYFDMIISNPPYIPTEDLIDLQSEVKFEPLIALNGGENGMVFYENITDLWENKIKVGGYIIYEVGISQEFDVMEILSKNNFKDIRYKKDLSKIPRAIIAKK